MDLFTLNASFNGYQMVEGYNSLIWTERFREAGEIQLQTAQIEKTLDLIPEGTLVGIRESREVMIIETHSIEKDDVGASILTTKGRSFETFLENRNLAGWYQEGWPMTRDYTVQDAILVIIWNALANTTDSDVTGGPLAHNYLEAVANLAITDSIVLQTSTSIDRAGRDNSTLDPTMAGDINDLRTAEEWWLEIGSVYPKILDMLSLGDLGIRTKRPAHTSNKVVTVDPGGVFLTTKGVITKTVTTSANTKLVVDIHNGRNRTVIPNSYDPLPPVIFRYDAGDIEAPSYLLSKKDFKNVARVGSPYTDGDTMVYDAPAGSPMPNGLELRELYVDSGEFGDEVTDYDAALRKKGLVELRKHNRLAMLDGAISVNADYVFGTHYDLGDYVTMVGEYGIMQDMQVSEYIRTEDVNGDRGYPTLIVKE